jgi:hypothetical protein
VEQTFKQWNKSWNRGGIFSLKVLVHKVLEQNKKVNSPGTTASKSVPPPSQRSIARGTSVEVGCKLETDNFLYDFEERLAIAEHDRFQNPVQAQRIAYLDAFIAVLVTLPYDEGKGDWLDQRVKAAIEWLLDQGIDQPK